MNITSSTEGPLSNTTIYCGAGLGNFQEAYSQVHGYVSLLVCQFGCVANVLNIAVLSRREMRSPTNAILTALAVADLLVMLDYIPYVCHVYLSSESRGDRDRFSYGWTTFVLFHSLFSQLCHTISICLTVVLAVWRYVAIAHPHNNRRWCNMERTVIALVMAYMLCPLVCLPLFLAVSVQTKQELLDAGGRRIKDGLTNQATNNFTANNPNATLTNLYYVQFNSWALERGELFKKLNFWIYGVVIKLMPCLALTVLSMRLILALLEAKRRRQNLMSGTLVMTAAGESEGKNGQVERIKEKRQHKKQLKMLDKERQTDRTTRMLLAVLLLFLLTEFPQGILGLLSAVLGEPFFQQCYIPLGDLMDILALINSAINFILYCSMSRQFRTTFKAVFRPRLFGRWLAVAQTPPDGNGHSTQVTQV